MKRFEFRLEGVLRHRRRVEKKGQILLGGAREKAAREARSLEEANAAAAEAREELRRKASVGEIDVASARQQRRHIGALAERVRGMTRRLSALESEVGRRREEAVQAQRDRKALETLRARRHAVHVRKSASAEQKELDDLSAKRAWTRGNGS